MKRPNIACKKVLLMTAATCANLCLYAQDYLITPPESVEIHYYTQENRPGCVKLAVADLDVYISGLSLEYPDAWVKGAVDGDKITLKSGQEVVRTPKGETLCFSRSDYSSYSDNHTHTSHVILANPVADDLILHIDGDGVIAPADENHGYLFTRDLKEGYSWSSWHGDDNTSADMYDYTSDYPFDASFRFKYTRIEGENQLTVTLANPGALAAEIAGRKQSLVKLKVNGTLGDVDFKTLREFVSDGVLEYIDLSEASLTDNKLPYGAFLNSGAESADMANVATLYLDRLILPSDVEELGEMSLAYCSFNRLSIPESVRKIGKNCFRGSETRGYDSKILLSGVETLEEGAFRDFTGGRLSMELPGSLKEILANAFKNSTIHISGFPEGLESIGDSAFYNCPMAAINLPESCVSLGKGVFSRFSTVPYLTEITLSSKIKELPEDMLKGQLKLEKFYLPEGVEVIREGALQNIGVKLSLNDNLRVLENPGRLGDLYGEQSANYYRAYSWQTPVAIPASMERLGLLTITDDSYSDEPFEVYCKALVPPECEMMTMRTGRKKALVSPFGYISVATHDTFPGIPDDETATPTRSYNQNSILYVPEGTADLYRAAQGWEWFEDIRETDNFPESGVISVSEETLPTGGKAYDLSGKRVDDASREGVLIKDGKKILKR